MPKQVVFVPLLLLTPTPLAPLLEAAALLLTDASAFAAPRRAFAALADAWYAVAQALVLVFAGAQTPAWRTRRGMRSRS